jgi:acyl-CoA thioesterase I
MTWLRTLAVSFAAILILSGCAVTPHARIDPARYPGRIRLACVGDSITFGSRLPNPGQESYPSQLAALLGPKWDVRNYGVGGATLLVHGDKPYKKQWAYTEALGLHPDVVVIMLGTNDSKPINWDAHHGEFVADYGDLIASFAALDTKPIIFLCRPPPALSPPNYKIRGDVIEKEVIPAIDSVARAHELGVIDIHAALMGRPELLPDRVHPNAVGAGLMADAVDRVLTGVR